MQTQQILITLPTGGFDPTETVWPWKVLTEAGYSVLFTTPTGEKSQADRRLLTGDGLSPWRFLLQAKSDTRYLYSLLNKDTRFNHPISYNEVNPEEYDGLVIPGGHDVQAKTCFDSPQLQQITVQFAQANKPIGAICHGVLVLARSKYPDTGKSIIAQKKVTALPKLYELGGWLLTFIWLGNYYRTYPQTVKDEITSALSDPKQFFPNALQIRHVVSDGNFITARYPRDAKLFSETFLNVLSTNQQ